jgi:ATP-dependent Clp protease ATP-binding subunit ClpA
MKKVVVKFLNEMNELLTEKNIVVRATESLIDHLTDVGFDPTMGARPLARKINDLVKVPLSKKMLFEGIIDGSVVIADWANDTVTFTITAPNVELLENKTVDENGIIQI